MPDPAAVQLCRVPDSAPPYDRAEVPAQSPAAEAPPAWGPAIAASAGTGRATGGESDRSGNAGPHEPHEPHETHEPHKTEPHKTEPHKTEPHKTEPHKAARDTAAPRETAGPGLAAAGSQPPPGWPSHFAQVLAETLAGSRAQRQLVPWTTERARAHIRRLGAQLSAAEQPRIRRVITFRPACDVVEMTVVVVFGARVRALAVRLERTDEAAPPGLPARPPRWLCTAVEAA